MEPKRKVQVLDATAVCMKTTNLPIIVVVGNDRVAFNYMKNETSIGLEQLDFRQVNVIIYQKECESEEECETCHQLFDESDLDIVNGKKICRTCEDLK